MKEYLKELSSIMMNTCDDIKELEKRYLDNNDRDSVKLISSLYTSIIKSTFNIEDELINIIDKSPSKKIVLDEDPSVIKTRVITLDHDPVILDDYNKSKNSHVITLDEDPIILQTREGKKIVLDEDPVTIYNKEGKKIVLDEDPIVLSNGFKKIILDEDPAFIKLESGKKIVLDEDPLVLKKIKDNNEIMDEFFSYSGDNITFDDDIYVINIPEANKNLVMDDKPGLFLNDMANRINSTSEDSNSNNGIHKIVLDEDPTSIVLANGKSIVLDEDPECLRIRVNGKSIVLDEDPEVLSKSFHKKIVLDEDPITIELEQK